MKKIIKTIILFLFIFCVGCKNKDVIDEVNLKISKVEISKEISLVIDSKDIIVNTEIWSIYDTDSANLFAHAYDEKGNVISGAAIDFYCDGEKLSGNCFRKDKAGSYLITAKYFDKISDPVEIKVIWTVKFKDSNLEKMIIKQNGIGTRHITETSAKGVKHIDINEDILSLEGIEYLTNTYDICFSSFDIGKIDSFEILYKLENLKTLGIADIKIDNIDFWNLTNLKKLKELNIIICGIKNLPDLSVLENLESLYINGGELKDLNFVKNMSKLKELIIVNNLITDISALNTVNNLEMLTLDDNEIIDISPISSLKFLQNISIAGNEIENIDALKSFAELKVLDIDRNKVSDLSALSQVKISELLTLNDNNIQKLDGIEYSTGLIEIRARNNPIESIEPLRNLKPRTVLMRGTNVKSLLPIIYYTNSILEFTLDLNDHGIEIQIQKLEENGCRFWEK